MSEEPSNPKNLNLEDMLPGIEKFVSQIEAEIELHHSHPEWIDYDVRCVQETNLIVRVGIIMGMLDKVLEQFKLPKKHELSKRIVHAKEYFKAADYM